MKSQWFKVQYSSQKGKQVLLKVSCFYCFKFSAKLTSCSSPDINVNKFFKFPNQYNPTTKYFIYEDLGDKSCQNNNAIYNTLGPMNPALHEVKGSAHNMYAYTGTLDFASSTDTSVR